MLAVAVKYNHRMSCIFVCYIQLIVKFSNCASDHPLLVYASIVSRILRLFYSEHQCPACNNEIITKLLVKPSSSILNVHVYHTKSTKLHKRILVAMKFVPCCWHIFGCSTSQANPFQYPVIYNFQDGHSTSSKCRTGQTLTVTTTSNLNDAWGCRMSVAIYVRKL